jgi:hypothetical protein
MIESENKTKSLEMLVNASRSKVDYLLNADNALDAKAGVMISVEVGIVTLYIQNINCVYTLSFIPIVVFSISIYLLLNMLISKTYNTGVVDFYNNPKDYHAMKLNVLLEQLLSDYQEAFDNNLKILEDKNKKYKCALILFLVGFILLIICI